MTDFKKISLWTERANFGLWKILLDFLQLAVLSRNDHSKFIGCRWCSTNIVVMFAAASR